MFNLEKFISDKGYYNNWKSPHAGDDRYTFAPNSPYGRTVQKMEDLFNSGEYRIDLAGSGKKFSRKDNLVVDMYVTRLSDGKKLRTKCKNGYNSYRPYLQNVAEAFYSCTQNFNK